MKLGKELENFQVALAKTNKIVTNYKEMYKILQEDYIANYISRDKVNKISETLIKNESNNIFGPSAALYYTQTKLSYEETRVQAELMRLLPDVNFLFFFLKAADNKHLSNILSYLLPKISTNINLHLNFNIFDDWLEENSIEDFKYKTIKPEFSFSKINRDNIINNDIFSCGDNKFSIRYLSNAHSPLDQYLQNQVVLSPSEKANFKKVIFHIHGGGFISMSSASHEPYLRNFAIETGTAIFSVDYPLAPLSKANHTIEIITKAYLFVLVF